MAYFKLDDESSEPFLENHEGKSSTKWTKKTLRRYIWLTSIIATLSLITHGWLLLFWPAPTTQISTCPPTQISRLYSPYQHVLETHVEEWASDAWENSVFTGPPRQEVEDAWDELQRVEGMRILPDEISKINLKSKIHLKNGDQGSITGYFHNLHCIHYLYQSLHPENFIREDPSDRLHDYHCVEVLRRSVLCQPDLTIHAIRWQDEEKLGMDLYPESKRECVNFEALYNFSLTRTFSRNSIVDVED